MRHAIISVACLITFVFGGICLERSPRFTPIRQSLQSRSVPSAMLQYGTMGEALKQLCAVRAVKNDYSRFPATKDGRPDPSASMFQRKRQVGPHLFESHPGGLKAMPSSVVISEDVLALDLPIISIVADEEDLYDHKRGIIANPLQKGRDWERLASVSYFEDRTLKFATNAGLRLHGGKPRRELYERKSYRLYFRSEYGTSQLCPEILSSLGKQPVKCLVVREEWPKNKPFNASLAFDISRRLGCIMPEIKPVIFYLNGEQRGFYYLTEQLSIEHFAGPAGDDDFVFCLHKSTDRSVPGSNSSFRELKRRARNMKKTITMNELQRAVDIDNLTRHLFSI
ncbi:CotH kinase family protein, partial [Acidobacteriota bacterium]